MRSSSSTRSTPSAVTAAPASAAGTTSGSRRSTRCSSRWTASTPARGVILIAATNRPDILDPALLRPGRFDRQIVVDRPDLEGRKAHPRGARQGQAARADDVDLDVIARRTPGFTGADLANLMNEAALLAARAEPAADRPCRARGGHRPGHGRARAQEPDHEREARSARSPTTRAATRWSVTCCRTPTRSTRSRSSPGAVRSGWTLALPTEDKYLRTRSELDGLAGHAPGRPHRRGDRLRRDHHRCRRTTSSGAPTSPAAWSPQYGMSDTLGPQQLGKVKGEVFLGHDKGHEADYSDEVAAVVDGEVRRLIDAAHDRARAILVHAPRHARPARQGPGREGDPRGRRPRRDLRSARQGHGDRGALSRNPPRSPVPVQPELVGVAGGRGPGLSRRLRAFRSSKRHRPSVGGGSASACAHRGPAAPEPRAPRTTGHRYADGPAAHRAGGARDPGRHRRGPRPRRPASTPRRVARMYAEIFTGLHDDPAEHLTVTFEAEPRRDGDGPRHPAAERVRAPPRPVQRARPTWPTSPATTAGSPGCRRSPGSSTGTAAAPQVQERLTAQIADAMEKTLEPRGVMVIIEAEHLCMSMRGVQKAGSTTVTSAVRGLFRANIATRAGGDALRHRAGLTQKPLRRRSCATNGRGIGVLDCRRCPSRVRS